MILLSRQPLAIALFVLLVAHLRTKNNQPSNGVSSQGYEPQGENTNDSGNNEDDMGKENVKEDEDNGDSQENNNTYYDGEDDEGDEYETMSYGSTTTYRPTLFYDMILGIGTNAPDWPKNKWSSRNSEHAWDKILEILREKNKLKKGINIVMCANMCPLGTVCKGIRCVYPDAPSSAGSFLTDSSKYIDNLSKRTSPEKLERVINAEMAKYIAKELLLDEKRKKKSSSSRFRSKKRRRLAAKKRKQRKLKSYYYRKCMRQFKIDYFCRKAMKEIIRNKG